MDLLRKAHRNMSKAETRRKITANVTAAAIGPLPTIDPPTLTNQNELKAFAAHGTRALIEANFVGPLDRLTGVVDEMRIARDRHGQTAVEFPDGWRLVPEWVTHQSVSERENNRIVTQIFIYEAVCASACFYAEDNALLQPGTHSAGISQGHLNITQLSVDDLKAFFEEMGLPTGQIASAIRRPVHAHNATHHGDPGPERSHADGGHSVIGRRAEGVGKAHTGGRVVLRHGGVRILQGRFSTQELRVYHDRQAQSDLLKAGFPDLVHLTSHIGLLPGRLH